MVRGSVVIPQSELVWRFSRSSGPGGQSVNTTDSRVQLVFDVANSPSLPDHLRDRALARLGSRLVDGCLVVTASEQRSQFQNRRAAESRLADVLGEAIAWCKQSNVRALPDTPRYGTKWGITVRIRTGCAPFCAYFDLARGEL